MERKWLDFSFFLMTGTYPRESLSMDRETCEVALRAVTPVSPVVFTSVDLSSTPLALPGLVRPTSSRKTGPWPGKMRSWTCLG